jgi:hypothetical protein
VALGLFRLVQVVEGRAHRAQMIGQGRQGAGDVVAHDRLREPL